MLRSSFAPQYSNATFARIQLMSLNLPEAFIQSIHQILGHDAPSFIAAMDTPSPTSIRLNPNKIVELPYRFTSQVPWCQYGQYLNERPSFITDPLWHAGAYYVQEASSMFVAKAIQHVKAFTNQPLTVLDACAAPGGKSTLLLSYLNGNDFLVSNEIIKSRVLMLADNLQRWGCTNYMVTNNDPEQIGQCSEMFDVILVDAPCSGEGMFRKDAGAIQHWSEQHVQLCAARQHRILEDLIPALKPGGFLIYSTCTFNIHENEMQVQQLLNRGFTSLNLDVSPEWGVQEIQSFQGNTLHAYRLMPHRLLGEGQFVSVLQKSGNLSTNDRITAVKKKIERKQTQTDFLNEYLNDHQVYSIVSDANKPVRILPTAIENTYQYFAKRLKVVTAGIDAGEQKGKTFIPSHGLALNKDLTYSQRAELSKSDAFAFLKKDNLSRSLFGPAGWTVVTYQNLPLGWVNVLPNRVNNYFPTVLRVLKQTEE
jgi:16S rRNA C967 or C1407 C5-methylase (RsmB/RsmF family)/NOL1/NOP2/fmu family ribosome biogenesis protein